MKEQEVAEAKPEEQEITESKAEQKPKVPSPPPHYSSTHTVHTVCLTRPIIPGRSFPMSFSRINRNLFATRYSALFLTLSWG